MILYMQSFWSRDCLVRPNIWDLQGDQAQKPRNTSKRSCLLGTQADIVSLNRKLRDRCPHRVPHWNGCSLEWSLNGVACLISSIFSVGEQPPSVWPTRGPLKSCPCAAVCWDGCPPMKPPVCLPYGVPWWLSGLACWCYSVVCILPSFSLEICPIQSILLSSLVSDTRVPHFLVYRSSSQPDVAGLM
jgi:hypothetical protein